MNESQSHKDVHVLPIKIAFFGTPEYAVPSLRSLHAGARYSISLVVTQPDRPAGRRRQLTASPVKIAAEELGLHLYQPESLKSRESREPLVGSGADIFVVAAYGLIFGGKTLSIPKLGCVNLHASLLPKYRGASPVAAAILAGAPETGVTLMVMDAGIDTGAVLDMTTVGVEPADTTTSLTRKLSVAGADLVVTRLADFVAGTLQPAPQPQKGASLTRMLIKDDGRIDWSEPAEAIERRVRAMWAWPRAWTTMGETTLQVHAARVVEQGFGDEPGQVLTLSDQPVVVCGRGGLALDVVQAAGGKPIPGTAWLAGLRGALPRLGGRVEAVSRPPLTIDF